MDPDPGPAPGSPVCARSRRPPAPTPRLPLRCQPDEIRITGMSRVAGSLLMRRHSSNPPAGHADIRQNRSTSSSVRSVSAWRGPWSWSTVAVGECGAHDGDVDGSSSTTRTRAASPGIDGAAGRGHVRRSCDSDEGRRPTVARPARLQATAVRSGPRSDRGEFDPRRLVPGPSPPRPRQRRPSVDAPVRAGLVVDRRQLGADFAQLGDEQFQQFSVQADIAPDTRRPAGSVQAGWDIALHGDTPCGRCPVQFRPVFAWVRHEWL